MQDHVIVCGLGQVGFQVTSLLLNLGEKVSVVTQKAREDWLRQSHAQGARVEHADARDPVALQQAGIASAKVLIACTSSDTTNIEIGLDAKRMRPDMRVIVRVFDRNLAQRLRTNFDIETISTASVAGSAFALAGLGEHAISEFDLQGTIMTVVRMEANESRLVGKSISQVENTLGFPVVLRLKSDHSVELVPGPDSPILEGEAIKVLVPTAALRQIHKMEVDDDEFDSFLQVMLRALNPLTLPRLLGTMWTNTTPELRAVFVLVNFVILLSVAVFHYGMDLRPIDAFYFVITTVTTVGYGDITPIDATVPIKLFACALMILGSASIAISYSIVTDYIVSTRLLQLGGRRRLPHHDHVVVVGLGDVGLRAAEELTISGARVVVVDSSTANPHVGTAQHRFATIVGDARDSATLRSARVHRARAIIATTNDDAANLSVGLAAKALNPKIRAIVRILDGEFARKVTERTNLEAAISAASVSAPDFVGAALHEHALTSFITEHQLITLVECAASEDGALKIGEITVGVRSMPLKLGGAAAH